MTHRESAFPLVRLRTAIASLIVSGETDASQAYSVVHSAFIGLLVALAYYVGSQVGFLLTPESSPIAVFWPPNAILLAALLLTPRRIWWVLILAVLPAHLLTQLRLGVPLTTTLGWFFGNTGEALLGAVCIRIFQKSKPLFECVHGVIVFLIFGVFLPTLTTSFFDAAGVIVSGLGQDYWSLWLTRLTSNIVADLTVVPTIVILGLKGLSWFRRANTLAYCEAAALAAGTVMVSLLVFGMDSAGSGVWALIYALLPLLIWGLLRFGTGGVTASLLVVTSISAWTTVHGRGPLGVQSLGYAVLSLHFMLTVLAASFLLSGALLAERHSDEKSLRIKCGNLVHAQDLEHYRIARELHDNILQRLTLVSLHLEELRTASLIFAKTPLNSVFDQISDISNRIRDLSHDLHPFMVEYLGLPRALRKLCRDTGDRGGIVIEFSEYNVTSLFPLEVSGCLFRVAQEALQNIVQYSHARTASMELKLAGGEAVLRVSDDGVGFDDRRPAGVGLTYLREQVLALDGKLEISSVPSRGTVVHVALPIGKSL